MVNDSAIVNVGNIIEIEYPPLEESVGDLEDARPDIYKDFLRYHQARIANLIGEKVERTAGSRRKPHSKVTWKFMENHIAPGEPEATQMCNEQANNVGYKDIYVLLRNEYYQDPLSALYDGTSYSQNPLCPKYMSKCTIFMKMWLQLSFLNWHSSFEELKKCVDQHNVHQAKKVTFFNKAKFLSGHSIMDAATIYPIHGTRLWIMEMITLTSVHSFYSLPASTSIRNCINSSTSISSSCKYTRSKS